MIESIQQRWRVLAERIEARTLRERALIFVALLAVIYVVAANLLFSPLHGQRERLARELKTQHEQIQTRELQIQSLAGVDGVATPGSRLAQLRAELKSFDDELAKTTAGLVTPKEMVRLVEQVLTRNRRLTVVKVESLPAAPLIENTAAADSTRAATGVYKHGMRLELTGAYLDLLAYLTALEGMQWKVFWGQASLQSDKPPARLTLLLYTLSTHEGWIGL